MPPITHTSWKRVSKRGEGATAHRIGAVALQQAVEAETPGGGADADRERGEHEPDRPADERAEQRERRRAARATAATITSSRSALRGDRARRSRRRSHRTRPPTSATPSPKRSSFRVKAVKNARKPTLPRSTAIALPASRMLGWCSSASASASSVLSSGARVDAFGILNAKIAATANTTAPTRSDQSAPKRCWTPAAGMPPTVAARTLISARRELALTSSDLSLTTAGTSALLAIE